MNRNAPIEATVVSVIIRDFIHLTERLSSVSLVVLMQRLLREGLRSG